LVGSSVEAEQIVSELVQGCGCSRADITLAARGPQSELTGGPGTTGDRSGDQGGTLVTVRAPSDEAAQCAAQLMKTRGQRHPAEETVGKGRLHVSKKAGGAGKPPPYAGPERRKRRISFSGLERRVAMR
jgi:hypothetical protein